MKSKIIKAVGKEILSLVCIILSIIGLLFVGHWLYSISNISMDSFRYSLFRLYWQCSIFMH